MLKFMNDLHELYPEYTKLCFAGGLFANVKMNQHINELEWVDEVYIMPPMGDEGLAVGACIYKAVELGEWKKPKKFKNVFLGSRYSNERIYQISKQYDFSVKKYTAKEMAQYIANGEIIGWFQGRTEFGARALGNRSILGNPHLPDIRDRINKVVKKREMFRPFAPSVTQEDYQTYFKSEEDVPYMNQVVQVISKTPIPSVTHVDNSARIQTVKKEQNPLYHSLLKAFEEITGTPILLNTSFNLKDKTMANSPEDAIWTFKNCDMDYLVLGNFLISK